MKQALPIVAVTCSVLALSCTMWILVPAQHTIFWLIAVVAGEWSLYFGFLAVVGVLLGIRIIRKRPSRTAMTAVLTGLIAVVFSSYPFVTSRPLAEQQGVTLSLKRYLFGGERIETSTIQAFVYSDADGTPLSLDAYLPSNLSAEPRPAVVVVHGGSWNGGERSDFPEWNHWLVSQGYTVFDIDYRLSPQPNWQTATNDVQDAVRWVKSRADSFNVDPNRIALMGRSAGGHLALLAAYTAVGQRADAEVQAVIGFYAPADLRWGYSAPANPRVIDGRATLRRFTGGSPNYIPEVYQGASPIHNIRPNTTPTLVVHGERDQLVGLPHTTRLMDALRRVETDNTRHQALYIPYAQHGFDYNFNGWGSQVVQQVMLEFLGAWSREVRESGSLEVRELSTRQ